MESVVGKILYDRYRIIQELSQDEISTIYIAEDFERHDDKTQCHIEQLQPQYAHEVLGARSWRKVYQTFIERATILKNLSQHPQIPELLDFFECDRYLYLVRECIEGESLAQKVQRSLITEIEAVSWLKEILVILEFVHQAEIAHLNIQPSSLIEHQDGRKFLTNFGTVKNAIFGNEALSPLSNRESEIFDYSSDIYALGKTIIYALTGKISVLDSNVNAFNLESNNLALDNIRPELAHVLSKMIGNSTEERYQSTAEVLADLDFNQNVVTFPPPLFNDLVSVKSNSRLVNSGEHQSISRSPTVQKIIWLLLALPFIVALGIIFIGINKNSYRSFESYTNDDYEFAIEYPEDWLPQELNDPITGATVVFTSPLKTDSDLFKEKVYISVESLPTATTNLAQYTQTVFERIQQVRGSDIEIDEDFQTTIDKSPARTVIYSREDSGLKLRQMETFTIKNNRAYVAIYMAEEEEFAKYLNTAKKIIDSWEIQ